MLLVIRRYILMLLTFRLILVILDISGLLNAHEGPMGTPDKYQLVFMYSPSRYLPIPTQLGLNNLDFTGYNKMTLPIVRLILPFWPFERQKGAPEDLKPIFLTFCVQSQLFFIYSMLSRLKRLRFQWLQQDIAYCCPFRGSLC